MKLATAFLSVSDYLKGEQNSPLRHEYLGGELFAMTGGSEAHNRIAGNLYARLLTHLRGSGCKTFIADMKVNIEIAQNTAVFYYPDVMVTCDAEDSEKYYKTRPCLIVEVLSPSTEKLDRREKRLNYQTLPSLQDYLLVSQEESTVELYHRDETGNWVRSIFEKDDTLPLKSVSLTLPVAEIYEEVL
ncbi:MAG: Uma2 family endonuclease [Cyanobacteria bacterium SID2]|nr:Uma2 family endonuclease [Cyanobacteria bacterium SID2]MBP0006832.1 Uma2 family endonuclease [Cyanobacteria bacterium SBC]